MAVFAEVAQLSVAVAPFPTPAVSAMTASFDLPAVFLQPLELPQPPCPGSAVPAPDPGLGLASTALALEWAACPAQL